MVTLLGTVLGSLFLVDTLMGQTSAPQQAAGAAIAVAFAILPYCFSRAVDGLADSGRDDLLKVMKEINEKLASSPKTVVPQQLNTTALTRFEVP